jgi:diguanylate cyclase (GGDEF)-like protein/PAS domain S-box-containing protein
MAPQEDFYKTLLDNLYDGIYFVDTERVITYWNKACERITGFTSEQVVGKSCQDNILNHCNEAGVELCKNGCPLTSTIQNGSLQETDVYLHHADGHRIPVRVRTSPIRDESGKIIGAVETFSNNTDLFKARYMIRNLEQTATLDPLTKIGNRRYGEIRLKSALMEFQETKNPFGLLFIDVDDFKKINDTYGHDIGDRILHIVANTIRLNLSQSDTIIRWGGEEFLILVDVSHPVNLREIAEKLRNLVERSHLQLANNEIGVTASIGATLAQANDTPETIVTRADQLMYKSKKAGKNQVTLG